MDGLFTRLLESFAGKKESKILMLGLDAAGKTTILYKLKVGEVVQSVPTIGFNVERVTYKNVEFTVWDIGGQDKIRMLWAHYFNAADGLIFVVDSSDRERIDLARSEMEKVLSAPEMSGCKVLVYANKADLGIMSLSETTEKLGLHNLRGHDWFVQSTCAINGDGLYDGLAWLTKTINTS